MKRKTLLGSLAITLLVSGYFWTAWQQPAHMQMAAAQGQSENLTPSVLNVTLTSADTEYGTLILPSGTRYFSLQCRTAADCRVAFVTGKVATPTAPYYTMKSGSAYNSPEKFATNQSGALTIYLASSSAGAVVECLYWY